MNSKVDISNILVQYNLPQTIDYRVETVDARSLLCPSRLDIAAKYLYLDLRGKCPEYAKKVYLEHMRVMTKGSFVEPYSDKNSPEKFLDFFDELYENIKKEGYSADVSPIPVDKNYRIMDGAHRVAICIKQGTKVPVVVLPMEAEYDNYNQEYFVKHGIKENILDEIIRCYVRLCEKCVCINIWPSAKGHEEELESIITKEFEVIYRKKVEFNETGAFYYLAQIYQEYSWAQNSDEGFSGVYRKLLPCFPSFDPVRTIIAEIDDYDKLISVKEHMRSLFDLDKHSLHITDNKNETIQMTDIILSDNTIRFLNKCNALQYKNTFKLLEEAKQLAHQYSDICFTGSVVLALFGIRQANDLDYIVYQDDVPESHNSLLPLYGIDKEQALYQADLQFDFFGLKFLSLECIKKFKERRAESKDFDDIKLIDMVLSGDKENWKVIYLRKKRRIIATVQGHIIRFAHKTGTYEALRQLYKKILS